ncbi:MAG: hypothetical protein ACPIOQ_50870 [Promethearchaeia archaeon]
MERHSEQQRLELLCRNAGQVGWHARFLPAPAGASKAGQPPSQERELAGQQPHKIAAMDFIRGAQEENLRTSSGSRVVSGQLVFESSPWKVRGLIAGSAQLAASAFSPGRVRRRTRLSSESPHRPPGSLKCGPTSQ